MLISSFWNGSWKVGIVIIGVVVEYKQTLVKNVVLSSNYMIYSANVR